MSKNRNSNACVAIIQSKSTDILYLSIVVDDLPYKVWKLSDLSPAAIDFCNELLTAYDLGYNITCQLPVTNNGKRKIIPNYYNLNDSTEPSNSFVKAVNKLFPGPKVETFTDSEELLNDDKIIGEECGITKEFVNEIQQEASSNDIVEFEEASEPVEEQPDFLKNYNPWEKKKEMESENKAADAIMPAISTGNDADNIIDEKPSSVENSARIPEPSTENSTTESLEPTNNIPVEDSSQTKNENDCVDTKEALSTSSKEPGSIISTTPSEPSPETNQNTSDAQPIKRPKFCPDCGAKLPANPKFCPSCGCALAVPVPVSPIVAHTESVSSESPVPEPVKEDIIPDEETSNIEIASGEQDSMDLLMSYLNKNSGG